MGYDVNVTYMSNVKKVTQMVYVQNVILTFDLNVDR